MKVSEWGNSLAVRLPKEVVIALGLKAGDEVRIVNKKSNPKQITIEKDKRREEAVERMRQRGWELPEGYKFNREEANSRK